MLVKGEKFEKLAEGVSTAAAMKKLGEIYNVELPITNAVYEMCYGEGVEDYKERANRLMVKLFERDIKTEFSS